MESSFDDTLNNLSDVTVCDSVSNSEALNPEELRMLQKERHCDNMRIIKPYRIRRPSSTVREWNWIDTCLDGTHHRFFEDTRVTL